MSKSGGTLLAWIAILLTVVSFTVTAVAIKRERQTQRDLTALTNSLCREYNIARKNSNSQIRVPLRLVLRAGATVIDLAADDPNTPRATARVYRDQAALLRDAAKNVSLVQPVTCSFGGKS